MPLRDHIFNKWAMKLAALGFATMIWLAVHSNLQKGINIPGDAIRTDITREFPRRPITVMTAAAERRAFRVIPDEVTVKVRAEIAVLNRLNAEDIQPFVKLTGRQEPRGPFAVQVYLPPDVSLEQVTPKAVQIEPVNQP